MKSAYFKIVLLILAMILMASCSGSGGKEGSSTKVTLKIGTADSSRKLFLGVLPLVTASNIPSIVKNITITVTASDITTISQSIPVTSSTLSLVTTFSVPNGSARVITVTGDDGRGNVSFKGSSSPLDLNGTDTSVPIQMVEDIKAAITARLLLYFKDTLDPRIQAGTLAAADVDPFYVSAGTYGINNGVPRDSVIAKDVKDFSADFLRKTMSTIQINTPQPDPQNIKYTVTGKGTFSDGSFGFPDNGFVMMKENGEWKFAGNGYKSDIKFRNAGFTFIVPGASSPILTGLAVSVSDPGNAGINSATIASPALTIDMIKNTGLAGSINLSFSSPPPACSGVALPGGSDLYCLTDAVINSIPANTTYTFTLKDVNNAVIETRTITLPARPLSSTELTTAHFPTLSIPPAYPAAPTDGHFLADAKIGAATGLSMTLSKPTAFAPSWLEASFQHSALGGFFNGFNRVLLLSDTSATLPAMLLPTLALGASASVMAEDFDNRREFRTFWQFAGPKISGPISWSPFLLGPPPAPNSQLTDPNGNSLITSPSAGTIWKFGDPPPVITWGFGFSSVDLLDIYLLADDPLKVATPVATGNPFPNVIWSKLNTSPVSGLTTSFTVSASELIGVAGSGCRILIVSFNSGAWTISPPFTIGP